MDILWWTCVLLAIAGTACVSVLRRVWTGHAFWVMSNFGLGSLSLLSGQFPLAAMFAVYLVLAVCGLFTWQEEEV